MTCVSTSAMPSRLISPLLLSPLLNLAMDFPKLNLAMDFLLLTD
jgi:hypothetical protein